jgi:hypothetical protein
MISVRKKLDPGTVRVCRLIRERPVWVKSGREGPSRTTAALPPTLDVNSGKSDIGTKASNDAAESVGGIYLLRLTVR